METPQSVEQLVYYIAAMAASAVITWALNLNSSKTSEKKLSKANDEVRNLKTALAYREGKLLPLLPPHEELELIKAIDRLMRDHKVDLVALFFACNGELAPTEVTSIWSAVGEGKNENFYRVAIDKDYSFRLSMMGQHGFIRFNTEDASPSSLIGGTYRDIKIAEALWVKLYYDANKSLGIAGYVFMSFCKTEKTPFTDTEIRSIISFCNIKARKMQYYKALQEASTQDQQ